LDETEPDPATPYRVPRRVDGRHNHLLGLTATPAAATPALVNCTGTYQPTYSPGATNDEQEILLSGENNGDCVRLTHPSLTSVRLPYGGPLVLSCTTLLTVEDFEATLYWNGATTLTSTWVLDATQASINSNLVATFTGPITNGVLAGSNLTIVGAYAPSDLAGCNQPGGIEELNRAST
jgi:hypothetical protein